MLSRMNTSELGHPFYLANNGNHEEEELQDDEMDDDQVEDEEMEDGEIEDGDGDMEEGELDDYRENNEDDNDG